LGDARGLTNVAMPFSEQCGPRCTMVYLIVLDKRTRFTVYTSTSESQIEYAPRRRLGVTLTQSQRSYRTTTISKIDCYRYLVLNDELYTFQACYGELLILH